MIPSNGPAGGAAADMLTQWNRLNVEPLGCPEHRTMLAGMVDEGGAHWFCAQCQVQGPGGRRGKQPATAHQVMLALRAAGLPASLEMPAPTRIHPASLPDGRVRLGLVVGGTGGRLRLMVFDPHGAMRALAAGSAGIVAAWCAAALGAPLGGGVPLLLTVLAVLATTAGSYIVSAQPFGQALRMDEVPVVEIRPEDWIDQEGSAVRVEQAASIGTTGLIQLGLSTGGELVRPESWTVKRVVLHGDPEAGT